MMQNDSLFDLAVSVERHSSTSDALRCQLPFCAFERVSIAGVRYWQAEKQGVATILLQQSRRHLLRVV